MNPPYLQVRTKEMTNTHPKLSSIETLRLHLLHFGPLFARGLFLPKRFWYRLLTRLPLYLRARNLITALREKHESDHLYVNLWRFKPLFVPTRNKTLLIYDDVSIKMVFDEPEVFGVDAKVKQELIALFQPGALVMSSGYDAEAKWNLNHQVLESESKTHSRGTEFLSLVQTEVRNMLSTSDEKVCWDQFANLSERITLQVILGQGKVDQELYEQLQKMIATSSRLALAHRSSKFESFYVKLREHLDRNSSVSLTEHWTKNFGDENEPSWAIFQITHWLFAMKDSLETHSARTLALISTHPEIENDVRSEIQQALNENGMLDPAAIASLKLLEGCVNEAIRLWTPIPLLVKRVLKSTSLGGEPIAKGCEVLIDGGYNNRDPKKYGSSADRFSPQIWVESSPRPPMNHFSNGARQCAGKNLGLFLIKAIVAELLVANRLVLQRPHLKENVPVPPAFDHYAVSFLRVS